LQLPIGADWGAACVDLSPHLARVLKVLPYALLLAVKPKAAQSP